MAKVSDHLSLARTRVQPGCERAWGSEEWSFVRVCSGAGFCSSGGAILELNAGDLLVVPARSRGCLRASQLGPLLLCHFRLQPRSLAGFFTLEEQRRLRVYAQNPGARPWRVAREDPLARSFSGICQLRSRPETTILRGEMLLLALRSFPRELAQSEGFRERPLRPADRLRSVMGMLTAAELRTTSSAELARKCGCGERHFRRLFRRRYGTSLIRYQMRLRIDLAKRLLEETDAKVTDVAMECGFQHFGLFSSLFKRGTGGTPSQWRARKAVGTARRISPLHSPCPPTPGAR